MVCIDTVTFYTETVKCIFTAVELYQTGDLFPFISENTVLTQINYIKH